MRIVPTKPATVVANATESIASGRSRVARPAAPHRRPADASAQRNAGALTGIVVMENATRRARPVTRSARMPFWRNLAAYVSGAGSTIREHSTLTTSTRRKNGGQRIGSIRPQFACLHGSAKSITSRFCVRIAIASRHGKIALSEERYFDIACRRIDDAQRQGRLFDDVPVPKPTQGIFAWAEKKEVDNLGRVAYIINCQPGMSPGANQRRAR